jgi:16S rRNA (guanine1207-N2)-methyltransferase
VSDHYFSREPDSTERRRRADVELWGHRLSLQTSSGVFSAGRLDIGTSVLFRETDPPVDRGTFLDLGCGYGVIACALAKAVPGSIVYAVDVNERALRLTGENARELGLGDQVRPALPADVPPDVVFDEIWSNPPIRIGKQALHDLLLAWLAHLSPAGRAVVVVGKNLGADSLQCWLRDQGFACERLASAKGFRVLVIRHT